MRAALNILTEIPKRGWWEIRQIPIKTNALVRVIFGMFIDDS